MLFDYKDVGRQMVRSLTRAWDYANEHWIAVRADSTGRLETRSLSKGLPGELLTDQVAGPFSGTLVAASIPIEGVVLKAMDGNTGTVYIIELNKTPATDGFPLAENETLSIGTSDLINVRVVVSAGDRLAYVAIPAMAA